METNELNVVHNADQNRFEIVLDAENIAEIVYELDGETIHYTHTRVPKAYEGRGIAGKLAKVAMNYAKENGLRVTPVCPYIASYIKKHPEYQSISNEAPPQDE